MSTLRGKKCVWFEIHIALKLVYCIFFYVLLTVHLSIILVILVISSTMCSKHVEAYNQLIIKQDFMH